jgi:integrase/recombinase XerD
MVENGIKYETLDRFKNIMSMEVSDNTLDSYDVDIRQLYNICISKLKLNINEISTDTELLKKINSRIVEDIFTDYRNNNTYKMKTINRKVSSYKSFGKYLANDTEINKNPFLTLKLYRPNKIKDVKHKDILTIEEINKIIDLSVNYKYFDTRAIRNTRTVAIMSIMATTGLRISEVTNMIFNMKEDIIEDNKVIGWKVFYTDEQTKNKEHKIIFIVNKAYELLNRYLEERNKMESEKKIKDEFKKLVFISDTGVELSKETNLNAIQRCVNKAKIINEETGKIKQIGNHSFRATFKTTLAFNGVNETIIKLLGGWKLNAIDESYVNKKYSDKKIIEIINIL